MDSPKQPGVSLVCTAELRRVKLDCLLVVWEVRGVASEGVKAGAGEEALYRLRAFAEVAA